jgi:tryptophan synthase beta subunit
MPVSYQRMSRFSSALRMQYRATRDPVAWGGSMVREVIEQTERSGELRPGETVVEATSGTTGIALAMVCAQQGYPLLVTMGENFSIGRRRLMRFLGAPSVRTHGRASALAGPALGCLRRDRPHRRLG